MHHHVILMMCEESESVWVMEVKVLELFAVRKDQGRNTMNVYCLCSICFINY
jgi:hypothetical protein